MGFWAAAIPFVGQAVGSYFGAKMQSEAQDRATAAEAANAAQNVALQREFAQHGIRWKVEDAKRAGLHPLAAIGAQTQSFSPVQIGTNPTDPWANFASEMGQNVSRAVQATATAEEREATRIKLAGAQAALDGQIIDNQIKASQLQRLNQVGPPMPSGGTDNFIPGQGNSALVVDKPLERTISAPGRPAQEAGWRPDVAFSRTDTGLTPVVPESLSESLEDDIIGKAMWRWRNQFVPNFDPQAVTPPKHMLPKGASKWSWSYSKQEWQPVFPRKVDSGVDYRRSNF